MIELPESHVLANELNNVLKKKTIKKVLVNASPHKFAWFNGDPLTYEFKLVGKTFSHAEPLGAMVELAFDSMRLVLGDGVTLRYISGHDSLPLKHQLLLEFVDGTFLVASVQMYGGLWCFEAGTFDNPYYLGAKQKISPYSDAFTEAYFFSIINNVKTVKLSAKAALATEQRFPGLGNGVLQDILFNAMIHPKTKISSLDQVQEHRLYESVVTTLNKMNIMGGRDTEIMLDGKPGGYHQILSKNTLTTPCPRCKNPIVKEAYMGGAIYYCPDCQPIQK